MDKPVENAVWNDGDSGIRREILMKDDDGKFEENFQHSTFEIISKVAYLTGVPKRIFENEYESPQMDVFSKMDQDESARIIRNLCMVRTAIERNFKFINDKMRFEGASLYNLPEHILPGQCLTQLAESGVNCIRNSNTKLFQHIIEINLLISDRINNCQRLFPLWLNWEYIRSLFIMPDGTKEAGLKAAAELYYSNRALYPYQVYINWNPQPEGNIFYNDKKFVTLPYQWNGDYFTEYSKVSDAGTQVKGGIYSFLEQGSKVVVVVDCENSDPYKLCAVLRNLDEAYTKKISSIILFDDVHAASAWEILENYTSIPVERNLIERVKSDKSLVDVILTARACREHYQNHADSFVLVSSDSDYWGLISSLPEARFLVMIERGQCSPDLKNAMMDAGIFYCYIDDFYSGNAEEIKHSALFREMYRYIDRNVRLNIHEMLDEALRSTRVEMSTSEQNQFLDRYVRNMQMSISENGDLVLEFRRK